MGYGELKTKAVSHLGQKILSDNNQVSFKIREVSRLISNSVLKFSPLNKCSLLLYFVVVQKYHFIAVFVWETFVCGSSLIFPT